MQDGESGRGNTMPMCMDVSKNSSRGRKLRMYRFRGVHVLIHVLEIWTPQASSFKPCCPHPIQYPKSSSGDPCFISCIRLWVADNVSLGPNPGRPVAGHCLIIFDFLGHLHELDNNIYWFQNLLVSSPKSDPWRALKVYGLALLKFDRYQLSRQQDDLDQSLLHFTEAIFLPLPWSSCPLTIAIFYSLTLAIFSRANAYRQHRDVKCCIAYLRYMRGQGLIPMTEILVSALAVQAKLNLGDVDQDIEEMADLCGELLNSQTTIPTGHIANFALAVCGRIQDLFVGRVPSENVLGCLRKAIIRFPDLHEVSFALAKSLLVRFNTTPSEDDYKEGMAMLDNVTNFRGWGDRASPYPEFSLEIAALFAKVHFDAFGKPENLEEAIYRSRTALDGLSLENPDRPLIMENLLHLQGLRFDGSSVAASVREVSIPSDSAKFLSFRDLTASLHELNDTRIPEVTRVGKHFDALGLTFIQRLTDMADIEDAIQYCRELMTSHPHSPLAPVALVSLSNLFGHAFACTSQIGYLNEAVSAARGCVNIAPSQPTRLASLLSLISLLSTRLMLLHCREDLNELMQAFAQVTTSDRLRLSFSFVWASIARSFGHPSTLTAYDRALSSMEATLTFSPTLDTQHLRLAARFDALTALPFDYTSYLIHTGRLKQAIETLERGRALLWSEMRGLRTSIDQIRLADSNLADKFAAVNRDLETLTLAFSPIGNVDGGDIGVHGMDPFGRLVVQQQKLLDDREKLISQIQALLGLTPF